jgi:uncharacterized membrane protein YgcG
MTKVVIVLALSIISTAAVISCKRGGPTQQAGVVTAAASPSVMASGYVIDSARVLDESTRKQLETTLAALHERKKVDFSVITVRSTGNKSAFSYSLELARERKNNRTNADVSGLLLLVAVDDRNWHIQTTRNLEKDLTSELLTNLSTPMTDSFRQNQFGEGIVKYVNAIIAKLEKLELAAAVEN